MLQTGCEMPRASRSRSCQRGAVSSTFKANLRRRVVKRWPAKFGRNRCLSTAVAESANAFCQAASAIAAHSTIRMFCMNAYILRNHAAFAALKADGSVVTWGNSNYGGNSSAVASPSVPTRLRHLPPGSLDPEVLKDRLSHAHARHRNLCGGGWRLERRP